MLITTLLPLLARYSLGFDLVAGPDDTVTLTVIPRRHEGAADKLESGETPLAEATTPSLEALKAYSAGRKILLSNGEGAAVPLFKRAVEIDPKFARESPRRRTRRRGRERLAVSTSRSCRRDRRRKGLARRLRFRGVAL